MAWISLVPAYKLSQLLFHEVGWPRTLATLMALALLLGVLSAAVAVAWRWAPRPTAWRDDAPWWPPALMGLAIASGWLLGLVVVYAHPRLAPVGTLLGSALAALFLFLVFLRNAPSDQRLAARGLLMAGRAFLLAPLVGLPWVAANLREREPLPPIALSATGAEPTAPQRILLITFDGLRARSTSMHNPALGNTPTMAAIAREATWFSRCHAISDRTQVSMPALLSGRDPQALFSRLDNRIGHLQEGRATGLAGYLAPAGYRGYFATMLVGPRPFGMHAEYRQGWETSQFVAPNHFNVRAYVPLGEVFSWVGQQLALGGADFQPSDDRLHATRRTLDLARQALRDETGPTFMWVHLGVPHTPFYDVPEADLGGELHPESYRRVMPGELNRKPHTRREVEQIYERYVRFGDAELGRFVKGLKADGRWDDTMVILTSDHGEMFRADGLMHGNGKAHEDLAHVPLLIRVPGQREARRVDSPVGHLDVVPTVLARVYGEAPAALPGTDLLSGPLPPERVTFTWSMFGRFSHMPHHHSLPQTLAAYQGRYKYVFERKSGAEALYDLDTDPEEASDLKSAQPMVWRRLKAASEAAYLR